MYITTYFRFLQKYLKLHKFATINCNFKKINYVRHPLSSNVHTYYCFSQNRVSMTMTMTMK